MSGQVSIANKRTSRPSKHDFYIGRPNALGNPFVIGKDGTRLEVIEKFGKYFEACLKNKNKLKFHAELRAIKTHLKKHGQVRLVCWCSPNPCHAAVIRTYLLKCAGIKIPNPKKSSTKSLF